MDVPPQLASIVGFSVLLALSLSMMLVIYNDNLFKEKPWVLYVLSGIMAFSIEVNWKWMRPHTHTSKALRSARRRNDLEHIESTWPWSKCQKQAISLEISNGLVHLLFLTDYGLDHVALKMHHFLSGEWPLIATCAMHVDFSLSSRREVRYSELNVTAKAAVRTYTQGHAAAFFFPLPSRRSWCWHFSSPASKLESSFLKAIKSYIWWYFLGYWCHRRPLVQPSRPSSFKRSSAHTSSSSVQCAYFESFESFGHLLLSTHRQKKAGLSLWLFVQLCLPWPFLGNWNISTSIVVIDFQQSCNTIFY